MRCPNCSSEQVETAAECASCGIIFAKWQLRQQRQTLPPAAQAQPPLSHSHPSPQGAPQRSDAPAPLSALAQLAVDSLTARPQKPAPKALDPWLLILSFPIVVPALILTWLMSSRWGRVDFWMIVIDGFVFTLFALRSPLILAAILLAWAASIALWFRRREKLDYGIFLGYSLKVSYCLIFGGIITAVGLFMVTPTSPKRYLTLSESRKKAAAENSRKGFYWLAPGILLLAGGVFLSRNE